MKPLVKRTPSSGLKPVGLESELNLGIASNEVGVLVLFHGQATLLVDDRTVVLDGPGTLIYNHLAVPKIVEVRGRPSSLSIYMSEERIQRALISIQYAPHRRVPFYEMLNSLVITNTREMSILCTSIDWYSRMTASGLSDGLLESKFIELFWLINLTDKVNFDRFIGFYLKSDQLMLDLVVANRYSKSFSNSELAQLAGMTMSSFKRKFSTLYKESPKRWVQNKRLLEAKSLLLRSNKSIKEIGYEVGFENTSYFIKSFREKFGLSPKLYKIKFLSESPESQFLTKSL